MSEGAEQLIADVLEKRIKTRLEEYRNLRSGFSDEIPTEFAHGKYQYTHKVSRNWWQVLISGLSLDLRLGLIPAESKAQVAGFIEKYKGPVYNAEELKSGVPKNHSLGEKTDQASIGEANNILDLIIGPDTPDSGKKSG